jgi:hypothetical protein
VSPLVVDHGAGKAGASGPRPGQWYPDQAKFGGTAHHVLVFGAIGDAAVLEKLARRWGNLVEVSHNPEVDRARAGLPAGGVVMVRPDGHIGFRFPAVDVDAFSALDRHLASYLVPVAGSKTL